MKEIFGVDFEQVPDITALRRFAHSNAFCAEDGQITGIGATEISRTALQLPALPHLVYLNVSDNASLQSLTFEEAPSALVHFDASDSGLTRLVLPSGLENLCWLDVNRCKLTNFESKGKLPSLRYLYLSKNQLSELTLDAPALQRAYISDNKLQSIRFPSVPTALEILQLDNNQLEKLPEQLLDFEGLKGLNVYGNPLPDIPPTLIAETRGDSSWEAIRNYLREFVGEEGKITEDRVIINDRAKLIIVGNGRVGKTSMYRRLAGQPFNEREPFTHGVQIGELDKSHLPKIKTDKLQLQVWDFGGQEIFHGTHQFFLSDEAVYCLAWTSRENVRPHQERDKESLPFDERWRQCAYWLENIRLRASDSPIVMVQTHTDNLRHKSSADPSWQRDYEANILDFSAAKDWGLDQLREILADRLNTAIPMLGKEFPKTYENVIQAIEALKDTEDFISYDRYLEVCNQAGIQEGGEETLLDYLVKTGVVVYFDKPLLRNVIYINSNWLTEQVYLLINNKLRPRKGRIDDAYLKEILPKKQYNDTQRAQFVELLKSFELIFQPKGSTHLIAPQYLPKALEPDAKKLHDKFLKHLQLGFVFRFTRFLPDNVMINFLSRYGPYSDDIIWKNGICFSDSHDADCIVHFDADTRSLTVYGNQDAPSRSLLRQVCKAFLELGKNARAEISLNGEVFASWQRLEKYAELYSKNPKAEFFATDETTALPVSDFMWLFGEEKRMHFAEPRMGNDAVDQDDRAYELFLSYARKDKSYFEVFREGLETQLKSTQIQINEIWFDETIPEGKDWLEEIEKKLEEAQIAILLVSSNFLASDFIKRIEFKRFLERRDQGDLLVFPMKLAPSNINSWPDLGAIQFFMPDGANFNLPHLKDFTFSDLVKFHPTNGEILPNPNRDRYFMKLAESIKGSIEAWRQDRGKS